eukprot:gene11545-11688_t
MLQAGNVPATDVCRNAYNAAGGLQGLSGNAPSCASQASFNLQKCCSEAKAILEKAPPNCLCNTEVWADVEKGVASAGISNLTPETVKQFAAFCQIKFAGNGC